MSKAQISSIDKANFYKLKPNNKTIFDTIKSQTNNKQSLRDLIMDYIIQKLFKQNHKQKSKYNKFNQFGINNQSLKKIPLQLQVQINGMKRKIQANGYYVLQKYIDFQKKNVYKQNNIQPLLVQILNFFDQMQQIADTINFQINQDQDLSNSIINILLEKYHKDKQKINRIKQIDMVKNKTVAKYTRVSYLDLQNKLQKKQCQIYVQKSTDNSHRVSRDTINSSLIDKQSNQLKDLKNSKSKLKDLVDNYKVFQHPQKIQQLRIQKLKQNYQTYEIQKLNQTFKKDHNNQFDINKKNQPNYEYINFLQNWITELSVSQKLFKQKLDLKQIKNKHNDVHVGKIIQESEDDQDKQVEQIKQRIKKRQNIK